MKGSIWLFEQEQALGFSSVSTNIRMTVIKLKSGGLWVHSPIAPTKECIQVRHINPEEDSDLHELQFHKLCHFVVYNLHKLRHLLFTM